MGLDLELNELEARALVERRHKVVNALAMFRPTEVQEDFFRAFSKDMVLEILLGGGNRCLHGSQEVYDPVLNVSRRIDQIDGPFHVNSLNPHTGNLEIKEASTPFVKGYGEMWEVTMSSGEVIRCTPEHRVVARDGTWVSIRQAWSEQIPLAALDTSADRDDSCTKSGRNKERQESRPTGVASSFSSAKAASRRQGTSRQYRHAAQADAGQPSFCGENAASPALTTRRKSLRSPQRSSSSIVQRVFRRMVELGSCELQQLFADEPRAYAAPLKCSCACNRTSSQCRVLTFSRPRKDGVNRFLPGTGMSVPLTDARRGSQTIADWKAYCQNEPRSCGEQIRSEEDIARGEPPSQVGVGGHNLANPHGDDAGTTRKYIPGRCYEFHPSNLRCVRDATMSVDEEDVTRASRCLSSTNSPRNVLRSRQSSLRNWPIFLRNRQDEQSFYSSHPPFFNLLHETASVTITTIIEIGRHLVWDITVEGYNNYSSAECSQSVISANSGKSTAAALSVASFILNEPITFKDGTQLYMRPERWRHEAVKIWIVGFDWAHQGKTLFRLLFEEDLFRIFRDPVTMQWRSWNPTDPAEKDKFSETRPSPPLLRTEDVIDGDNGFSWENKKDKQLRRVQMANDGTILEFFASTGSRPQGDPVHLIWVDERMADEGWYTELLVRLIDFRGRLLWTAWPTTAPSSIMTEMRERATLEKQKDNPRTFAFTLAGKANPFTDSEHRDYIFGTMDEDTKLARDDGVMSTDRWRVYARFSKYQHRAVGPDPEADDDLARAIRARNCIPPDWTRYLILDPGTINPAVLFVAVPPLKFGDFIVPYDEIHLSYRNAKEIAQAVALKTKGQVLEDMIVDSHAARITPMGFGGTIGENYEKEFAAAGVRCARRGSRFSFGSDDVMQRIYGLQGLLNFRGDGTTKLRLFGCAELIKQLDKYQWESDAQGNPIEKPKKNQKIDVAVCLEYFVSRDDCGYVKPKHIHLLDPKGLDSVRSKFSSMFGPSKKKEDRSIYCGAGQPPE